MALSSASVVRVSCLRDEQYWEISNQHSPILHPSCINNPWLPHLHTLPPLPVLARAIGTVVHSPVSFLYHWSYTTKLHPSKSKNIGVEDWIMPLFILTSSRVDYFLMTTAYNLNCAYRQFVKRKWDLVATKFKSQYQSSCTYCQFCGEDTTATLYSFWSSLYWVGVFLLRIQLVDGHSQCFMWCLLFCRI